METTHQDPRLIEPGTETPFGVTERQTLTGWFMVGGEFVPFTTMAPTRPVTPLVIFG